MNRVSSRKLRRKHLAVSAVAVTAAFVQLSSCFALMSETSSAAATTTAGKHWSDVEINHLLDRLIEWRTGGKFGDGGNFPQSAYTAASVYLISKGFARTPKQCDSKYSQVCDLFSVFRECVLTISSDLGQEPPQSYLCLHHQDIGNSLGQ